MKILPVILSGGSGTRLWPLSRTAIPKQLQPLCGAETMMQQTAARLHGMVGVLPPVVVCNESQRFLVAEQLRAIDIRPSQIILEPEGRNTAPAIAVPALLVEDPEDTVMVVMSSDHYIDTVDAFRQTILNAVTAAMNGHLMTIGVNPTRPHTGYGYIQKGQALENSDGAYEVTSFKEKPDLATVKAYLDEGDYLWNAGIFAFRADRFLEELTRFEPTVVTSCRDAVSKAQTDQDFLRLDRGAFFKSPNISIDYAVMEKATKVGVVSASFAWSDVGGWNALHELGQKDGVDNVVQGDVLLQNVRGSYVRSESRLVSVLGLDNVVVVETPDAVMVASKERVDEVKAMVEELKVQGRIEASEYKKD